MRAHGAHAGVQEQGSGALRNLTANADNKVAAGRAGAIEAVVAAMRAHGAHAGVQEQGSGALSNMAGSGAALQARCREAGAVAVLRTAIKVLPGGEVAQKALNKLKCNGAGIYSYLYVLDLGKYSTATRFMHPR